MEHSYHKRYNFLTMNNGSRYTDDPGEIVKADREGGVKFVHEGYADEKYHDDVTEIIRRTDREVPRQEWERLGRASLLADEWASTSSVFIGGPNSKGRRRLYEAALEIIDEERKA